MNAASSLIRCQVKIREIALLAFALTPLNGNSVSAEEWRYCLGITAQQRIYLSEPFQTPQSYENVERTFKHALDANGVSYVVVQCPLSETAQDARQMRAYTIQFNRDRGVNIVDFQWRPAPGSAAH